MRQYKLEIDIELTEKDQMQVTMSTEGDVEILEVFTFTTVLEYLEKLKENKPLDKRERQTLDIFLGIGKSVLLGASDYVHSDSFSQGLENEFDKTGEALMKFYKDIYKYEK